MERLTVYTPDGYKSINPVDLCLDKYSDINFERILDKLGAYEDFEEIFRGKMTNAACDILSDKEEFGKWLDRNRWIAKKCDEWARAEEQGRLVKLPCKVGDTVWDNDYGRPCAYTITAFSFGECEEYICEPVTTKEVVFYYANSSGSITGSFAEREIGKSVFLSRAEAEAKLKELRGMK